MEGSATLCLREADVKFEVPSKFSDHLNSRLSVSDLEASQMPCMFSEDRHSVPSIFTFDVFYFFIFWVSVYGYEYTNEGFHRG